MPLHPHRPAYEARRLAELFKALALKRRLRARESWSRPEIEALQRRRLKETVAHATTRSRFYRDLYASLPDPENAPLDRLPVVSKEQLMGRFDDWVTDSRLKLPALQEHLETFEGPDGYYLGRYRVLTTSGSSGPKGVFVLSSAEWSLVQAQLLRVMDVVGVGFRFRLGRRMKCAAIGAGRPLHVSYRTAASVDVGATKLLTLKATTPLPELVEALNDFQPDWLNSYPSVASLLADEQLGGRLNISPSRVSTVAELRTQDMAERMTAAWGTRPFDIYWTTEAGILGLECEQHRLHAIDDELMFEIVDESNRPVPANEPGHKLLVTSFSRRVQPLIRYEIGDMLALSPESCSCGRPFPVLTSIEGRSDEILYLADSNGCEVPIQPSVFRSPLGAEREVRQYEVVQRDEGLVVRIIPDDGADRDALRNRVAARLQDGLTSAGAAMPDLRVEAVDEIERDPRKMSKLKLVRSEALSPAAKSKG
jgi:phenylacetate-coenzyme A ligase PaaK-like adenylate-forming protein